MPSLSSRLRYTGGAKPQRRGCLTRFRHPFFIRTAATRELPRTRNSQKVKKTVSPPRIHAVPACGQRRSDRWIRLLCPARFAAAAYARTKSGCTPVLPRRRSPRTDVLPPRCNPARSRRGGRVARDVRFRRRGTALSRPGNDPSGGPGAPSGLPRKRSYLRRTFGSYERTSHSPAKSICPPESVRVESECEQRTLALP